MGSFLFARFPPTHHRRFKYQPDKIDCAWHTYFIATAEDLYDYLTGNYNPACIVDADEDPFNENPFDEEVDWFA